MPNRNQESSLSRKLILWILSGVVLLGLIVFVYEPVKSRLKVRSEVQKWHDRVQRQKAGLQGDIGSNLASVPQQTHPVPPTIDSDFTLTTALSPWLMTNDVTVPSGFTLSMEPGVEVWVGDQVSLFVFGTLLAAGTEAQPVRLHSFSPSNFWAGIFFGDSSAPSLLRHVEMANAQYGIRPVLSEVILEECVTRNLREVCSAMDSQTVFRNCRFLYEDFTLTGNINVFKFYKGSVFMENCEVYCPETDLKIDAIDVDHVERGVFRGNRIHGSTCQGSDGIDVGVGSQNVWIEGNLITDLVDKGISAGEGASVVVTNNIIARCGMGVGIKDEGRVLISHTTFYGNGVGVHCYEKVRGEGGGHAEVRFSVFAAHTNAPILVDELSTLTVADSWCDTQVLPGPGNVQRTPIFENPDLDLFNLAPDASTNAPVVESASPMASMNPGKPGAHIMKPGQNP